MHARGLAGPWKSSTVIPEDTHEFISRDFDGSERNGLDASGRGEIVVITVEGATAEAKLLSKGVQLVI
jgi:hypothetical protein